MSSNRTVSRVLVMIEYGPGDPNNGEVFDLTALAKEMLPQAAYRHASLGLKITAERSWSGDQDEPKVTIGFDGDAGNWVYGASHLDDVVNSALPDGERVAAIRTRAKRLETSAHKKIEQLKRDAMVAKLEQVAGIRHLRPIARVTEAPIAALGGGAT